MHASRWPGKVTPGQGSARVLLHLMLSAFLAKKLGHGARADFRPCLSLAGRANAMLPDTRRTMTQQRLHSSKAFIELLTELNKAQSQGANPITQFKYV